MTQHLLVERILRQYDAVAREQWQRPKAASFSAVAEQNLLLLMSEPKVVSQHEHGTTLLPLLGIEPLNQLPCTLALLVRNEQLRRASAAVAALSIDLEPIWIDSVVEKTLNEPRQPHLLVDPPTRLGSASRVPSTHPFESRRKKCG